MLKNNSNFINEIVEIIHENNIKGIIVGNPINMDGSKGPSAQSANDFAKHLSKNVSIPVTMWDERMSSVGAFNLSSNLDINISKKLKNWTKMQPLLYYRGPLITLLDK